MRDVLDRPPFLGSRFFGLFPTHPLHCITTISRCVYAVIPSSLYNFCCLFGAAVINDRVIAAGFTLTMMVARSAE
jgi:hypothetical protein